MTDLFEEKSRDWDQRNMVVELSRAVGSALHERVPLRPNMRVMDFGAGTGLVSAHVAPHVATIAAVDTSRAMLDKLVAKPELQAKVEAVCQDIVATPLNRRFDLIVSAMALHHVEDTSALFHAFANLLDDGGTVALADLDTEDGSFHAPDTEGVYHAGFDRDALRSLLEENGFSRVEFTTAHTVDKPERSFPIFLVTAVKATAA